MIKMLRSTKSGVKPLEWACERREITRPYCFILTIEPKVLWMRTRVGGRGDVLSMRLREERASLRALVFGEWEWK